MRRTKIFLKVGLTVLAISWLVPVTAMAGWGLAWAMGWNTGLIIAQTSCGKEMLPLDIYENLSLYSLIAGFVLVFAAIFLEKKKLKIGLSAAAVLPFLVWGYVNFLVDYDHIRRTIFNYNLQAEATLANIAEAQERYKSEQGNFIKDLQGIKSHLAGAHGMDECVEILELNVSFEHWSAVARHRSSPDTVRWDSTSGSSLKKG